MSKAYPLCQPLKSAVRNLAVSASCWALAWPQSPTATAAIRQWQTPVNARAGRAPILTPLRTRMSHPEAGHDPAQLVGDLGQLGHRLVGLVERAGLRLHGLRHRVDVAGDGGAAVGGVADAAAHLVGGGRLL